MNQSKLEDLASELVMKFWGLEESAFWKDPKVAWGDIFGIVKHSLEEGMRLQRQEQNKNVAEESR